MLQIAEFVALLLFVIYYVQLNVFPDFSVNENIVAHDLYYLMY